MGFKEASAAGERRSTTAGSPRCRSCRLPAMRAISFVATDDGSKRVRIFYALLVNAML
jgi:hypothetical protein